MKARRWRTLGSERVYTTPIFDLHRRKSAHPRRGERDFYVLAAPGWVNIIPVTRSREVVLVRQYRHGISAFTLEIPGGMIDPEDPNPAEAARREMREECGFDSDIIIPLGRVHPNPAIQPNFCYSFFARNVRKVAEPRPNYEGSEETEVVLVPLAEIKPMIASGKITHALVIAAFSLYHVYNPPPRIGEKAHKQ
ncbi:MAG TPA: NUDIX hydrolase [Candidatus Binataceae bacterium]|nr:NUDIX hydrolase [Candidatus Binataceae bacterium]